MRIICKRSKLLIVLVALATISLSVFAGYLGMDPDNRWGGSRIGLLAFGLIIMVILVIDQSISLIDNKLLTRPEAARRPPVARLAERSRLFSWLRATPYSRNSKWLGLILIFVFIELIYLVLARGAHLSGSPRSTVFYDLMADAFLQGQTSLLVQPDPALAELEYPWPTSQRPYIPVLSDASYFRGKYYAYWGPAPALLLAGWKLIKNQPIGDEMIAFFGVSLTFLFSALSLFHLRRRFFPDIPAWFTMFLILFLATAHPMLWVINPALIYGAAIACGQAFLIAGVFFVLPLWGEAGRETWRFFLVGVLWSLAIASRLVLLGAVAVLVIVSGLSLLKTLNMVGGKRTLAVKLGALILPLVISVTLLGLYNYVRFGDIFETGVRYQLSMNDLNQISNDGLFMSLRFVPGNLLYYGLTPLRLRGTFPFVRAFYAPVPGFVSLLRVFRTPDILFIENATGIFSAAPMLLIILPMTWKLICAFVESRSLNLTQHASVNNKQKIIAYRLFGVFVIAGIAAALPFLLLFWVATRYLLDVIPLLGLGGVLASMIFYTEHRAYPVRWRVTTLLITFLAITGVVFGFLLAISGPDSVFDELNPKLIHWINILPIR
jgi:hypothetical protein